METDQERANRQFNDEVSHDKPILDIVTLQAMYPQYSDWLEEEARRRGENKECNCGNCLAVALEKEFGVEMPVSPDIYRLGWPPEDYAYPEGWHKLNRGNLKDDGSGWEVGDHD